MACAPLPGNRVIIDSDLSATYWRMACAPLQRDRVITDEVPSAAYWRMPCAATVSAAFAVVAALPVDFDPRPDRHEVIDDRRCPQRQRDTTPGRCISIRQRISIGVERVRMEAIEP